MLISSLQENILKISSKQKYFLFLNRLYFLRNLCENTRQLINQYPFENVINIKDLLAVICRRTSLPIDNETLQSYPLWLPTTFNLTYELSKFVSYFQQREKKFVSNFQIKISFLFNHRNLDNHWIVKPFNLARSIDTHVTKNINAIIRLAESGPKVNKIIFKNEIDFIFLQLDCLQIY